MAGQRCQQGLRFNVGEGKWQTFLRAGLKEAQDRFSAFVRRFLVSIPVSREMMQRWNLGDPEVILRVSQIA